MTNLATLDRQGLEKSVRNRSLTTQAILAAARHIFETQGYHSLGLNAIAREAMCDKQLIYRYYNGLDGLIDALANDIAEGLSDSLKRHKPHIKPVFTKKQAANTLIMAYLTACLNEEAVHQALRFDVSAPAQFSHPIAKARLNVLTDWLSHAPVFNSEDMSSLSLLMGIIHQFILMSRPAKNLIFHDLTNAKDSEALLKGLLSLINRAF